MYQTSTSKARPQIAPLEHLPEGNDLAIFKLVKCVTKLQVDTPLFASVEGAQTFAWRQCGIFLTKGVQLDIVPHLKERKAPPVAILVPQGYWLWWVQGYVFIDSQLHT